MRTFVSIDIPKYVGREVQRIQEQLPYFRGKKTKIENLHLTLKFLGEIDKERVEEVRERLRKIRLNKFETGLGGIGFFDNQKRGVIWLHVPYCEKLQKEIDRRLSDLFEPEKRFMSHLTIARVKPPYSKDALEAEFEKIKMSLVKFRVNEFKLKESLPGPLGHTYKTVEEYPLI
jgi:2'-5' RNA ligase